MPSRMTAVNASTARPNTVPSLSARSTAAWSSPLTDAACRRIQNSIQVTTVAASSIVIPSKICSYGSFRPPTVRNRIAPTARLAATAAAVPAQILPKCRRFPVRARYVRMMLTISAASTPSRRPVSRPLVNDPRSIEGLLCAGGTRDDAQNAGAAGGRCRRSKAMLAGLPVGRQATFTRTRKPP